MLPDLSRHLHTAECNHLIDRFFECQKEKGQIARLFGACDWWHEAVYQCCHKEDLSCLDEADFDQIEWLNSLLSGVDSLGELELEQLTNAALIKVQLCAEDVSRSLDNTAQEVINVLPKVMRDVDAMRGEAQLMQSRMSSIQQDVHRLEQDTTQAMKTLLRLDTAKSRMMAVDAILTEMDNWSTLMSDMESVLASSNAQMIAERLMALQNCLSKIDQMDGSDTKAEYLQQMKDQFLSAIAPSVVTAFSEQNASSLQYFSSLFRDLHRAQDLERCYATYIKSNLCQLWQRLCEDEKPPEQLLIALHDAILRIWFAEIRWASVAMGDRALTAVAQALCAAMESSVNSSLYDVLSNGISSTPDQLASLYALKKQCDTMMKSVESSLRENRDVHIQLSRTINEPILRLSEHLASYLQNNLLTRINHHHFTDKSFSMAVKTARDSMGAVYVDASQLVDESVDCVGPVAVVFLQKPLNIYFGNYMSKLSKILTLLGSPGGDEDWKMVDLVLNLSVVCGDGLLGLDKLNQQLNLLRSAIHQPLDTTEWSFEYQLRHQPFVKSAMANFSLQFSSGSSSSSSVHVEIRMDSGSVDVPVLPDVQRQMNKFTIRVVRRAIEQIAAPITALIQSIHTLNWASSTMGDSLSADLPAFSLTPHEYMTKIGQYLLSLAHRLEPFLGIPEMFRSLALVPGGVPGGVQGSDESQSWLSRVGDVTMRRLVENVLRLRALSKSGALQLHADIEYLCNVLDDLGVAPNSDLVELRESLRSSSSSSSSTMEGTVASAIRQIRAASSSSQS